MSVIPSECTCNNSGTCRYCKMIAWGITSGVAPISKIVGPRAAPVARVRAPDADDVGSFASAGRSNSARAKRKARLTRIQKERERYAAAKAARVARARELGVSSKWGDVSPEQVLSAGTQCDAAHCHAPMTDTLRRHLEGYLRRNEGLALLVLDTTADDDDTDEADDYRNKVARPSYLTAGTWPRRD